MENWGPGVSMEFCRISLTFPINQISLQCQSTNILSILKSWELPLFARLIFPLQKKKAFFFSCSCIPLPPGFPRDSGIALQLGALLGGSCHSRMVTPEEGWKLEMLGQWVEQTPGSREQQGTHSGTYSDMSQSLKSVLWSRLE